MQFRQRRLRLDIGGEGRHPDAWNLNPSPTRTVGPHRGTPIPRHIPGRADCIPLDTSSVYCIVVERTPLTLPALHEIARVICPEGIVVLRHAIPPGLDPHRVALRVLRGTVRRRKIPRGPVTWQQTAIRKIEPI